MPDASQGAPAERAGFAALGVPPFLVKALLATGIDAPYPIQTQTLPDALDGRDVLGRGRTGSGKTLAFAIPVVDAIAGCDRPQRAKRPRGLVLVPTRELAMQVAATFTPLAEAAGLRVATVFGGTGEAPQIKALARGVDIVVGCPGRLEDLIGRGFCRLDDVIVTVLDEADHMADLGFLKPVERLLDLTPRDGQRLLFSATLDERVQSLVRRYLSKPVTHSVEALDAPVPGALHHLLAVSADDKAAVVGNLAALAPRTLLFTRTKRGAQRLAARLARSGATVGELHGNLSQNARVRNLSGFSDGSLRVLVATDIAARGIHVDDIRLVVHVDPPAEHKTFVHRSGRTARAGAPGVVVTLVTPDQEREVVQMARKAGIGANLRSVTAGSPLVSLLDLHEDAAAPQAAPPRPIPTAAITALRERDVTSTQPPRRRRRRGAPGGGAGQAPRTTRSGGRPTSPARVR